MAYELLHNADIIVGKCCLCLLLLHVAVACCLCLALAAASCQVFKSLGGSQTVVPPRLDLGLGSVGPVSLSPSPSLSLSFFWSGIWYRWCLCFIYSSKIMQNAIAAGGRDRKRDKQKQRLQAKDVTISDGRVYQVNGYLRHTLNYNTHNLH